MALEESAVESRILVILVRAVRARKQQPARSPIPIHRDLLGTATGRAALLKQKSAA